MIQSNEPYERVHTMEESTPSLGIIAKHVGIGLASSAALEGGIYTAAKKLSPTKHELAHVFANSAAFAQSDTGNKFLDYAMSGTSTKKGRIANYGTAAGLGLLSGMLESSIRHSTSS